VLARYTIGLSVEHLYTFNMSQSLQSGFIHTFSLFILAQPSQLYPNALHNNMESIFPLVQSSCIYYKSTDHPFFFLASSKPSSYVMPAEGGSCSSQWHEHKQYVLHKACFFVSFFGLNTCPQHLHLS